MHSIAIRSFSLKKTFVFLKFQFNFSTVQLSYTLSSILGESLLYQQYFAFRYFFSGSIFKKLLKSLYNFREKLTSKLRAYVCFFFFFFELFTLKVIFRHLQRFLLSPSSLLLKQIHLSIYQNLVLSIFYYIPLLYLIV